MDDVTRRQDAATTTVGAGLTATGGVLRHAAAAKHINDTGKKVRFHGPSIVLRGGKLTRRTYLGGAAVGLVGAPALGIGATRFVRGDKDEINKRGDKDSFLREGVKGTVSAAVERTDTLREKVPARARAAGYATTAGAGTAGVIAARIALRKRPGLKPLGSPIAGVLAGAAATPLSSKVVHHVAPGYEVTPAGVKRKKKGLKRPSSASFQHYGSPRSFSSDVAKDASSRKYRAKVTAAGSIPVAGYGLQAAAAANGASSRKDKIQAGAFQGGSALAGDVAGAMAGAHGGAYLARKSPKVAAQSEKAFHGLNNLRGKVGLKPKELKPAQAASTRTGKIIRGATKPLHGKYAAAGMVGAVGGTLLAGNTASQLAISHNYKTHVRKSATTPGMTRAEERKQIKRRSRLVAINTMGATVGAAGLATFAASKHPKLVLHKPALESATLGLGAMGGGVGSYGGFKRAKVERKEIRAQRKALGVSKSIPDPMDLAAKTPLSVKKAPVLKPTVSPAGALKTKAYTASSLRQTPTGKLVRVKAGLR